MKRRWPDDLVRRVRGLHEQGHGEVRIRTILGRDYREPPSRYTIRGWISGATRRCA